MQPKYNPLYSRKGERDNVMLLELLNAECLHNTQSTQFRGIHKWNTATAAVSKDTPAYLLFFPLRERETCQQWILNDPYDPGTYSFPMVALSKTAMIWCLSRHAEKAVCFIVLVWRGSRIRMYLGDNCIWWQEAFLTWVQLARINCYHYLAISGCWLARFICTWIVMLLVRSFTSNVKADSSLV